MYGDGDRTLSTAARAPERRAPRPRGGLSRRVLAGPQTGEAYLRASSPPRYMQRMREIEREFHRQRCRLEDAYRALGEACGGDARLFSERWRAQAQAWPFRRLNELIREHNTWYPVEADLAMDPRTCDYVPIRGASYRRIELGPEWVLAHLPPSFEAGVEPPVLPRRTPREPLAPRRSLPRPGPSVARDAA